MAPGSIWKVEPISSRRFAPPSPTVSTAPDWIQSAQPVPESTQLSVVDRTWFAWTTNMSPPVKSAGFAPVPSGYVHQLPRLVGSVAIGDE